MKCACRVGGGGLDSWMGCQSSGGRTERLYGDRKAKWMGYSQGGRGQVGVL